MRKLFTTILGAAMFLPVMAQGDDFGLWTSVGVEKKINKRLSAELGADMRFEDNLQQVHRWGFNVGLDYKIIPKILKLGVGYIFMDDYNPREEKANYNSSGNLNGYNIDHDFYRDKHRFVVDLTGKISIGRFGIALRERYQFTHLVTQNVARDKYRGVITNIDNYTGRYYYDGTNYYGYRDPEGGGNTDIDVKRCKNKHYLRQRLQLTYNIKGIPLEPYASFEMSNNLSNGFSIDKRRWRAGATYTIKKQHELNLGYVYTNAEDDDQNGNLHCIEVGYKFKF